jgi:hypothetical protein
MSQTNFIQLGPDAKVAINIQGTWTLWDVTEGRYRDIGDEVETTDTGSTPYKQNKVGNIVFEADITCQRSTDSGWAAAIAGDINAGNFDIMTPFSLIPKGSIGLRLYTDVGKRSDWNVALDHYDIPDFRVGGNEGDFRVRGSEPQTLVVRGKSNGQYTRQTLS